MSRVQGVIDAFADHRMVDLTRRLEPGIPSYPTHPKYFQMPWRSMGDPAEMNQLVLGDHVTIYDGVHFYLGLDNNHGADVDLVSVVAHELAHGLGFLISVAGARFQTDRVMVGIILIALAGIAMTAVLRAIERRFEDWRPRERG